jgi:hypothetical protein
MPSGTKPQTIIFALLISTQATPASAFTAQSYRQGSDFAPPTKKEFNVLYLRSCPKQVQLVNVYERVGVGIMFGEDAKRGFDLAVERQVQLI